MLYPFFTQSNDYDCGLACLQMLYQYYFKRKLNIDEIKDKNFLFANRGINLLTLKKIAAEYGLNLSGYKMQKNNIDIFVVQNPVIMQVINEKMLYHFVVIYKRKKNLFLLADPASHNLEWITLASLSKIFTGVIVNCIRENVAIPYINNDNKVRQKNKFFSLFKKSNFYFYVIFFIFTNIILGLLYFFNQLVYKQIINQFFFFEKLQIIIFALLFIFLLNNIIYSIHAFLLDLLMQKNHYHLLLQLIKQVHQHWFALKPITMNNYSASFYLQIYHDIENLTTFFTNSLLNLVVNFIFFVFVSFYLIQINVWIWLISVSINFINFILQLLLTYFQKNKIKAVMKQNLKLQNKIISTYNNFETLYFRNLLERNNIEHHQKFIKTAAKEKQIRKMQSCNNFFNSFTKNIFNFLLLWFFVIYLFRQWLKISDLIFINSINIYVINFFNSLTLNFISFFELKQSWNRFQQFLQLPKKTTQSLQLQNTDKKIVNIKIKNCIFKIDSVFILNKINFDFNKHTVLIGPNGCGKTMLLSIIVRKFTNYEGTIMIDKQELKTISDEYWAEKCVYLNSNAIVINGTVSAYIFNNNITNEKLDLYQKLKLNELLALINLDLDSYCHEHLSQGQKQVLNLCQLFFYSWKIILLDEALSNVNNDFKQQLLKKLMLHFSDCIIIYTTHDQKMQILFPRCAYFYQGKIILYDERKK